MDLDAWQRWNTIQFQTELNRYARGLQRLDRRSALRFMDALERFCAEFDYHASRRAVMVDDEMTLGDAESLVKDAERRSKDEDES